MGKTTGGISITDILKPYLLDQEMCFIGATTKKEAQLLLSNEAFKRRFTTIMLEEPSDDILIEIKNSFEEIVVNQQLLDDQEAKDVIRILRDKLKKQHFPDKFVDFMDYMYACKRIKEVNLSYGDVLEEYIYDQGFEVFDEKCQVGFISRPFLEFGENLATCHFDGVSNNARVHFGRNCTIAIKFYGSSNVN